MAINSQRSALYYEGIQSKYDGNFSAAANSVRRSANRVYIWEIKHFQAEFFFWSG
jgi:hypothetical protein